MKTWAVLLLCGLVFTTAVSALEAGGAEPLDCDVGAECTALASLNIFINGVGSCSGSARADCVAFAAAIQDCDEPIREKIELDECTPQDIELAAECYAAAIAFVYVKAYTEIECEGQAAGCGYAHANGRAWACTFAAALVELQVSVGAEAAVCEATIAAMAGAFAAAAAEVQAEACVEGDGVDSDFESAFVLRVQEIIASALATCWVDCSDGMAVAEVEGEGMVSEIVTDIEVGEDTTSAGGTFALPCNPFAEEGDPDAC